MKNKNKVDKIRAELESIIESTKQLIKDYVGHKTYVIELGGDNKISFNGPLDLAGNDADELIDEIYGSVRFQGHKLISDIIRDSEMLSEHGCDAIYKLLKKEHKEARKIFASLEKRYYKVVGEDSFFHGDVYSPLLNNKECSADSIIEDWELDQPVKMFSVDKSIWYNSFDELLEEENPIEGTIVFYGNKDRSEEKIVRRFTRLESK